jgi:hypothetical protein
MSMNAAFGLPDAAAETQILMGRAGRRSSSRRRNRLGPSSHDRLS